MKSKAIICDIDGVVLQCPYFVDIEEFYKNIEICTPIEWCVDLINGLHEKGYTILFLTARDSKCRGITKYQLEQCFKFPIHLYMRLNGDIRPDHVIKKEHMDILMMKYDICLALDDNVNNCNMFHSLGIPTVHVIR